MAGADLRVPFDLMLDTFGVPAVVTRPAPANDPIDTTAVWLPALPEDVPFGGSFQRQEPRKVLALPLVDVPTVPRGTLIVAAAALGGTEQTWQVDSTERVEFDHVRVMVIQVPDE